MTVFLYLIHISTSLSHLKLASDYLFWWRGEFSGDLDVNKAVFDKDGGGAMLLFK